MGELGQVFSDHLKLQFTAMDKLVEGSALLACEFGKRDDSMLVSQ